MPSFADYRDKKYPAALEVIRSQLRYETRLDALEELGLRLMWLLEGDHIAIPETGAGKIFRLLAPKAINEVFGLCRMLQSWLYLGSAPPHPLAHGDLRELGAHRHGR
jgi:hypothetical protein